MFVKRRALCSVNAYLVLIFRGSVAPFTFLYRSVRKRPVGIETR